jgi:hypothetical protein
MDEILELRQYMQQGKYDAALLIINEMEEMAKDDKLNKIYSFAIILLLHLIKEKAEQRTTRSWRISLRNAVENVQRVNTRRNAGGTYCTTADLEQTLEAAYNQALRYASEEAFGGIYTPKNLGAMINKDAIILEALHFLEHGLPDDDSE